MMTSIRLLLLLPFALLAAATPRYELKEQRGRYQLNFDATYVTYVNNDVETAITLPEGYLITATMAGSRDYVSVGALQNTVYISKAVNHAITTNLILHVRTPEGTDEKLVFELRGNDKAPPVYAIHFDRPNSSELNRTVEAMKSRYQGELAAKLSEQERKLTEDVTEKTLKHSMPIFFNCHRGDISEEYKGATVYLDGVITHEQNSYVYLRTDIKREDCNVVRLLKVQSGKDYSSIPELIFTQENADGTLTLVYRVIALPLKDRKTRKVEFNVEIWSKTFQLTQKIS
jgi:hypothetical protein